MQFTFKLIKQIISILSTGIILLTFIITILSTNSKSPNYIEYTELSKFLLNLYTLIILSLIFAHSVYPPIICSIFAKRFAIILSEKGKIIILTSIFIMYFGTGSLPQKLFGMIGFIGTFSLFLSSLFTNCGSFKKNDFTEEKRISNISTNDSKNITTTTEGFNNSAINNSVNL